MASLVERDARAVARLQKLRFFPLTVTGGRGARLRDEDGRWLLDLSASWGAASLGHGHPAIRDAVAAALADQAGASILSAVTAPAVELAERLLEIVPGSGGGERRVWLGHSGSDANEAVARAVVAATGRPRIVSFSGAYHGGTAGSMAVSGHAVQAHAAKAEGLLSLPYPDPYRPFEDDPTGARVAAHLEARFATDCPPGEVAAFFLEPIQSDGGMIVPPPGAMARLADICRRHGILVVADEVKVGLGRSGRLHCFAHDGLEPDIVTLGKGLGGGLPVSAAIGPAAILDHAGAFAMQTLHGNPVSAAAALAVLGTIEREGLVRRAAQVGAVLTEGLRGLMARHPLIGDVRGRGLAIGVELVRDRATREPAREETARLVFRAHQLGLVLYYVGMNSNVLEFTPPLTLTEAEAAEAVDILDRAFADIAAGMIAPEEVAAFAGWG